ncbi:MAG TPA: hypothetical protein VHW23_13820 [Kofleriaceae bacterium]|jgi:hypothetical protein|nr:hypothetical protein [Kofleriaceae bacterium]
MPKRLGVSKARCAGASWWRAVVDRRDPRAGEVPGCGWRRACPARRRAFERERQPVLVERERPIAPQAEIPAAPAIEHGAGCDVEPRHATAERDQLVGAAPGDIDDTGQRDGPSQRSAGVAQRDATRSGDRDQRTIWTHVMARRARQDPREPGVLAVRERRGDAARGAPPFAKRLRVGPEVERADLDDRHPAVVVTVEHLPGHVAVIQGRIEQLDPARGPEFPRLAKPA